MQPGPRVHDTGIGLAQGRYERGRITPDGLRRRKPTSSTEVWTMDKDFKRLTDFLIGIGIEQVPHTHKSYLAHLIAVFRSLESRGCPEEVCRAGMFHSIYGTERFQGF